MRTTTYVFMEKSEKYQQFLVEKNTLSGIALYRYKMYTFFCIALLIFFTLLFIFLQIDDIPKHLMAEFNLGCHNSDIDHTYRVYVTTFLGMI